jgi:hypothetical protein
VSARSKASLRLARDIRLATDDGRELLQLALGIIRDPEASRGDRQRAAEFLADRGWGKAPQHIEGEVTVGPRVDLRRHTDAELALWETLARKALPAGEGEGEVN